LAARISGKIETEENDRLLTVKEKKTKARLKQIQNETQPSGGLHCGSRRRLA